DRVATITLNSPTKRNALEPAMREELAAAVRDIRSSRSVRAVVLTGAGGHFCAGGDLRNIASANLDNAGWHDRMHALHDWLHGLLTLDRPVVAAVDGAAAGAGFSLAAAADFVLATPRAWFNMSFLKVGLVPDVGAFYTLPRIVGAQRAKELMLSARDVRADEALRLGIVMELHEPADLLPRAHALARSFVGASPTAVAMIKRSLQESLGGGLQGLLTAEAHAQAIAAGTAEHKEAIACFLNKQPPPFVWPLASSTAGTSA
ncbi:MAG: enoyl-CoA hydratase/isomerase family protein, partial [Serpentinimonas sp.]|nr:enoyl-CoA hydratase/isomerase family protein [Serpentinimonas sp.]